MLGLLKNSLSWMLEMHPISTIAYARNWIWIIVKFTPVLMSAQDVLLVITFTRTPVMPIP